MNIRLAQDSDLHAIVEIYNQSIPGRMATADLNPVSVEEKKDWFHGHTKNRPIVVAEENGMIVGWGSLKNFYGRPAYSGTAEASIYIRNNEQNKGIGEKLLLHLIEIAPALDIHTLLGFIFAHNLPSISLVKKHGFEEWGMLPDVAVMMNEKISLLILGKKLPPI
jgi:L-amino acid N-acyltransferase YncA